MIQTISRAELLALGGTADATHAVFHADGSLYFCVVLMSPDNERERGFWAEREKTLKQVIQ